MSIRRTANWCVAATLGCVAWAIGVQDAAAQFATPPAGVIVDAEGVLRKQVFPDPTGALTRERMAAAQAALSHDLAEPTKLRLISLNRLERAIADNFDHDRPLTEEMRYLAGLTRLEYVFFYPDTGDIVIGGPAEGWMTDLAGRVVGVVSGRPMLELQDLLVALRAYPPGKREQPMIGCSIDPTEEGLARLQEFLRQTGRTATPGDTAYIVEGLRTNLGLQKVRIEGVPPTTHFAQVLVEADYRMKLIGIGLEQPPVKLVSYVDRASASQAARNALQRWYFMPDYDAVCVAEDQLAMQLVGNGVKLVAADEHVGADGRRSGTTSVDGASRAFVTSFTQKYTALAAKSPVYGQLRNLIDMAIAAAFIQEQDYYGDAKWTMDTLLSEEKLPVETCTAPVQVESAVNAIWKGTRLMTPIGGGVTIRAHEALDPDRLQPDEGGKLAKVRGKTALDHLAPGQWWWSAGEPAK